MNSNLPSLASQFSESAVLQLQAFRRELHAHPELSLQEKETARRVREFLSAFHPTQIHECANGKAFLVEFDSGKPGQAVLFRADLDALPILEKSQSQHQSKNTGVTHACGHDGHMTLVCSLALRAHEVLKQTGGKLGLLFQHAEEIGQGAKEVVEDQAFLKWGATQVFGFHNIPGEPLGKVMTSHDVFSCASMGIRFELNGKTAHAAEPGLACSPLAAIMAAIKRAQERNHPEHDDDFFLATPVHVNLGEENYGITPGNGRLCFTLRAKNETRMLEVRDELKALVLEQSKTTGVEVIVSEFDYFPDLKVTPEEVRLVSDAVAAEKLELAQKSFPFLWSEDFGYFTQKIPGCYFGLGIGEHQKPLHDPEYDFNDEAIAIYAPLLTRLAVSSLTRFSKN